MFDSTEFSFADISVNILGANLTGLRGIKYKKSQSKDLVTGQGNNPKTIQRGEKAYSGTLKVLKSDYDAMELAAIAAGYEDLIDVPFKEIVCTIVHQKNDGSPILTDILYGLEFTEVEDGQDTGSKFGEISLPFVFLKKQKV